MRSVRSSWSTERACFTCHLASLHLHKCHPLPPPSSAPRRARNLWQSLVLVQQVSSQVLPASEQRLYYPTFFFRLTIRLPPTDLCLVGW